MTLDQFHYALTILVILRRHGSQMHGHDVHAEAGFRGRRLDPVLQSLSRLGVISSAPGKKGGFSLTDAGRTVDAEQLWRTMFPKGHWSLTLAARWRGMPLEDALGESERRAA